MNKRDKQPPPRIVDARPVMIVGTIVLLVFALAIIYPELRSMLPEPVDRGSATSTEPSLAEQFENNSATSSADGTSSESGSTNTRVVARNLSVPWDIAFLPDQTQLVTERSGTLVRFQGTSSTDIRVPQVNATGEGGLLGVAPHPNFPENNFLYLYTTDVNLSGVVNRVVRFRFNLATNELTERRVLIDDIPGAPYHDGGRIAFGPDGYLYITTGDAGDADQAQSTDTLAGKILRINPDGSIPADNPFGDAIYSYGHRNPQGLTWDGQGNLWSTEHGRSGSQSGFDELNLIEKGKNYGWPKIQGPQTQGGMVAPKAQSGPETTWAPASALFWDGSIFFGGLRGSALYEAVLDGTEVTEVKKHFFNEFGRIRTIVQGPFGFFYITTSNTDGRGDPREGDDKVIRINPQIFRDGQ